MRTKFNGILTLLLAFTVHFAFAQKSISGTVSDESGPLPGVSVLIKDTSTGVETDFDGKYNIQANIGDVLQYSYIGMETAFKTVGDSNTIDVVMQSSSENVLDEVIVTAYGGKKAKRAITGSVEQVNTEDIVTVPVSSFAESIKGKITGLQSLNASGQPGSSTTVQIRGMGSVTGDTEPLYVIDGIPMNKEASAAGPAAVNKSSLAQINQADIESVTVLKDASATSIYGARGSNGVILITTKKGKQGNTKFEFSNQTSFSARASKLDVLSKEDYIMLSREGVVNSGASQEIAENMYPDTDYDTDWQAAAFSDDALTTKTNLSASGGNEKTNFYTSLGYEDQEGIALGSYLKKVSGKVNVHNKATDNLGINFNIFGSRSKQGTPLTDSAYFVSPVVGGYLYAPDTALRNEDGTPNQDIPFMGASFLAQYEYDVDDFTTYRVISDVSADYKFFKNFTYSPKIGVDFQYANYGTYDSPLTAGNTAEGIGRASKDISDALLLNVSNVLKYQTTIADNYKIDLLLGQEATQFVEENIYTSAENFASPELQTLVSGAEPTEAWSYNGDWTLLSYFSNLNLGLFDSKYNLSATIRRDASSRFGADHKWGTFWAVGANWNINNEKVFDNLDWLNKLKLRASYGIQGNIPLEFYGHLAAMEAGYDYEGNPGQYEERVENPDLKWEEQTLWEVGLDFRFFDRLKGEVSYYNRGTADLIIPVLISYTSGDPNNEADRNFADFENVGYEAKIGVDIIKTDNFEWSVDGNITHNENTVTNLVEDEVEDGTKIRKIGEAWNTFYMPVWAGVNPDTGAPQWELDEGGEITEVYDDAEKQIIDNADPDFYGGFGSYLRYKKIDFGLSFFTSQGNQIYNNTSRITQSDGGFTSINQTTEQLDRWQNPGDITDVPQRIHGGNNNSNQMSTRWLEDGSYVRLKNVSLSYNFGDGLEKYGFNNVRFFLQGHNVYTWTDFSFDPEQSVNGTSWFVYPNIKSYSLGVNLSF